MIESDWPHEAWPTYSPPHDWFLDEDQDHEMTIDKTRVQNCEVRLSSDISSNGPLRKCKIILNLFVWLFPLFRETRKRIFFLKHFENCDQKENWKFNFSRAKEKLSSHFFSRFFLRSRLLSMTAVDVEIHCQGIKIYMIFWDWIITFMLRGLQGISCQSPEAFKKRFSLWDDIIICICRQPSQFSNTCLLCSVEDFLSQSIKLVFNLSHFVSMAK